MATLAAELYVIHVIFRYLNIDCMIPGTVNGVAFTPDGTHIISGSQDKTLRMWCLASGQCVAVLPGHEGAGRGGALENKWGRGR